MYYGIVFEENVANMKLWKCGSYFILKRNGLKASENKHKLSLSVNSAVSRTSLVSKTL